VIVGRKTQRIKDPKKVAAGKARMARLRASGELSAFQRRAFDALVEKVGMDEVMEKVRKWRIKNPSAPERVLLAQLRDLGYLDATLMAPGQARGEKHFRREHRPIDGMWFTVDFALCPDDGVRHAIEVDGPVHRQALFTNAARQHFEQERDFQIEREHNWCITRVSDDDLHSDYWELVLASVLEAVELRMRNTRRVAASDSDLDEMPY
jgi:very-short-patch-repair endonuclease